MNRSRSLPLIFAALTFAFRSPAPAQTLPPSTQDRQEIATLEFQASLPGTDAATRAVIERRIATLEYKIATLPPIAPASLIIPQQTVPLSWNAHASVMTRGSLPQLATQTIPMQPAIYGSCAADRDVFAYLQQQLTLRSTIAQERQYDRMRIENLQRSMSSRHC